MRRPIALFVLGLASISLSGCGLVNRFFGGEQAEETTEDVEIITAEEAEAEAEAAEEDFSEPLVPAAPGAALISQAELIQSTDSSERVRQIERSRPNPYAVVPVPPPPSAVPAPTDSPTRNTASPGATPRTSPGAAPGTAPGAAPGSRPGGTAPGAAGRDGIAALPPLPRPEFAPGIEVSGVVRTGGGVYAIVQAPGEDSRYVQVGQRVSNNRVLVKRIEMIGSPQPVVIFEENGIEVARPVGSGTGPMGDDGETAAAGREPVAILPPL